MNEELRARIRELRKENHLSQEEMAKLLRDKYNLKTDRAMISKWETGFQAPEIHTIKCIADLFNVSMDYLNGMKSNIFNIDGIRAIKMKKYPMLGNIACGEPITAIQDYETFVEASDDINADFCLTAKGDSMIDANIHNGDIVFIREQPTVDNGQIAAVLIEDEVTLKRVYIQDDTMTLLPANQSYAPIIYKKSDALNIKILGRAMVVQSIIK